MQSEELQDEEYRYGDYFVKNGRLGYRGGHSQMVPLSRGLTKSIVTCKVFEFFFQP